MTEASPTTVLVTGIGALIGQGIARSLRQVDGVRIIGLDRKITPLAQSFCDIGIQKPAVAETDEAYVAFWSDLVRAHRVDVVLPGLGADVAFLRRAAPVLERQGCAVLVNRPELIDLCADKLLFGEALAAAGFPTIPTARPAQWSEACTLLGPPPFLLKPRSGEGSAGIVRLEDEADFAYWTRKNSDNWMIQRIVGRDDEEYTVGVFGLGGGDCVGPIVFRRTLARAGHTAYAEVVRNDAIHDMTMRLVRHFTPVGPTNLQFRMEAGHPYLLEINPRFSSSCSLRTAFGFNEARMAIEWLRHGRVVTDVHVGKGRAWRYNEDFVQHDGDHF